MVLLDLYMDSRISVKTYFIIILFIHKSIGECQNGIFYINEGSHGGFSTKNFFSENDRVTENNLNIGWKVEILTRENVFSEKKWFWHTTYKKITKNALLFNHSIMSNCRQKVSKHFFLLTFLVFIQF